MIKNASHNVTKCLIKTILWTDVKKNGINNPFKDYGMTDTRFVHHLHINYSGIFLVLWINDSTVYDLFIQMYNIFYL